MIAPSSPAYVWITISIGIAAIVWAFLPGEFRTGRTGQRGKPIPRWFGRLGFVATIPPMMSRACVVRSWGLRKGLAVARPLSSAFLHQMLLP